MARTDRIVRIILPDGSAERLWIDLDKVMCGTERVKPADMHGAVITHASFWALHRLSELGFDMRSSTDSAELRTTTIRLSTEDRAMISELMQRAGLGMNDVVRAGLRMMYDKRNSNEDIN